jgi:hypothetical protein
VSFAAITLCVASQRVFIVVSVYFVIDSENLCVCISRILITGLRYKHFTVLKLNVQHTP